MLCDRCTHRLGAVGFRDLPGVEDGGHQRSITLPDDLVPEPGRPTNITPGTACLRRTFTTSDPAYRSIRTVNRRGDAEVPPAPDGYRRCHIAATTMNNHHQNRQPAVL
jgi:hypothetical protein